MDQRNGQLPHIIYVRRRIAAVVVLVLLIALIVWIVKAVGGSNDAQLAAETETSVSVATTTASSASSSPSETEDSDHSDTDKESAADGKRNESADGAAAEASTIPEDRASENTESTAAPDPELTDPAHGCSLEDLIITASSDQAAYAPGVQPHFYMTVKNPTGTDCRINLGDNVLRFEVYDLATNHRIWSDVDCNAAVDTTERIFPAGEERYYEAIWSRTGSAPQACANRTPVAPGSYYLHTLVGNNHSDAHPFNLT